MGKKKHSYAEFRAALVKEVKVMITDTNHEGWALAIVHAAERIVQDLKHRDPKETDQSDEPVVTAGDE